MLHVLVSACLTGVNCKYNGGNNRNEKLLSVMERLKGKAEFHLICPEQMGGLPIPHPASEIRPSDHAVIGKDGRDVTAEFLLGADIALRTATKYGCTMDGTFSGRVIPGMGKTAGLLAEQGIRPFGESQIEEFLKAAETGE